MSCMRYSYKRLHLYVYTCLDVWRTVAPDILMLGSYINNLNKATDDAEKFFIHTYICEIIIKDYVY